MTRLSPHFSLEEMTRSNAAARAGVANVPSPLQLERLYLTADRMEGVRSLCGNRSISVFSGFRSLQVNRLVGGSKTSAHMDGDAVDFKVHGMDIGTTVDFLKHSPLKFDQVIDEFGQWVHIGFSPAMRRQVLRARKVNGKTVYTAI